ncbi:unnamed protein product [Parnassius apollo]|uniref:(apollo) hypothetical protein n=1 Tax=Parnassius apollo TaxID=110799 RepID=A0A8S3X018_PARAO|nr:unnamed protein product [Parnassius apollo]
MSTQRTPPCTMSQKIENDSDGGHHTSAPASNNVAKRPSKRAAVYSPPIGNLPEGADYATNTALRNIIEDVVLREMSDLLTKLNISMGTLLKTQLKSIKDEIQDYNEIPNCKGKVLDLVFLEQSNLLVQVDRATDVAAIVVLHPPLEILLKSKKYYNLAQNYNFTSRNFF